MKLLLDMGNSSITWGCYGNTGYDHGGCFFYSEQDHVTQLEKNLELATPPETVLLASVASDADNARLQEWVLDKWQCAFWQANTGKRFKDLVNRYDNVQQMGVDRWLAMIAAREEFESALCVVDCGTAVTLDLVEASGKHAGGFILPGSRLMQQSLLENTDRIRVTASGEPALEPAANTRDALSRGACLAMVAAIERACSDFQATIPDRLQCIMTGGSANELIPLLGIPVHHRPQLVLDGLAMLYEKER